MPRGWLARLFTEDVGAKALALFLAILVWAGVSIVGSQTVTVEDVPVGPVGLRDDVALAAPLSPVDVKVRAPRLLLRKQGPISPLRAFVDMSGRGIGPQSGEISVTSSDPRVDVVVVLPARAEFTLDPVVTRSLPVIVAAEGTPAAGFLVGESTVEPKTVQARGAVRRFQEVAAIPVRVPVQGASAVVEGEFPLSAPEGIIVLTPQVRVRLILAQTEELRTIGVRVVTRGTPASGYWIRSVSADPSSVTVRGAREALGEQTFLDTVAVNVDEARKPIDSSAELALPTGVRVHGGETTVRVRVDVAPLEGSREVSASVQVENVPDELRVGSVSPGTVSVTVRGSGENLDRLSEGDVRVVISAAGQGAGSFSVRPRPEQVRVPSGVGVVSVEGVDVNVTLEQ